MQRLHCTAVGGQRTVAGILSEPGATRRLGELIAERFHGIRRPFIVTDTGLLRTGLLDLPKLSLEQEGMRPTIFSGVITDPPEAVVLEAVEAARRHEADLILGFGGGSSMDVAKLVAVLAGSQQAIGEMYGIGKVSGQRLPLVQVPTTAGTGSEVTNIAIVTTGATTKSGIVAPQLYARRDRHRCDGACHRSLYEQAQEEPAVRCAGP